MTTALQIIEGAARLIGVIRKGEALSADEAADGLTALNDLLSSWSNNNLITWSRTWEQFNITPAASYTIGTGQTLNTERPMQIRSAFIRSGGIDHGMEPLTDEEYEDIVTKSVTSPWPLWFNYDNGFPTGILRFWPQVSTAGELHLLSEKQLSSFAALTTSASFPPGWNKALRFNLAIDLAPEYGVQVSKETAKGATDSLNAVTLSVAQNRPIKFKGKTSGDPGYGLFIYTGY